MDATDAACVDRAADRGGAEAAAPARGDAPGGTVGFSDTTWQGDAVDIIYLAPNTETVQRVGDFTVPADPIEIETPLEGLSIGIGPSVLYLVADSDAPRFDFGDAEFVGFKVTDLSRAPLGFAASDPNSTIRLDPEGLVYGDNFVQVDPLETSGLRAGGVLNVDLRFAS